jgi:hypothetical protein
MDAAIQLPDPDQVQARIRLCRAELNELKRLLRASLAADKIKQAREAREALTRRREAADVR